MAKKGKEKNGKGKGKSGKGKARHLKSEAKKEKQVKSKRRIRHMPKNKAVRKALRAFDEQDQDMRDALLDNELHMKRPKKKSRTIPRKHLVLPRAFSRHDKDNLAGLENVEHFKPADVVKIRGSKFYVVVDGGRSIREQMSRGQRSFKCNVIGIADSRSQITLHFAINRVQFRKDATVLEKTQAVSVLSKHLHKEFPGKIRGHGGSPDQISEVQRIQKHLGLSDRATRYLLNFGKQIGEDALMGLPQHGVTLTFDEVERLVTEGTAEKIGQTAAGLLEKKREKLGRKLSADEREEIAGKCAYQIIKPRKAPVSKDGDGFKTDQTYKAIGSEGIAECKDLEKAIQTEWKTLIGLSAARKEFSNADTAAWFKQREAFDRAYTQLLEHMSVKGILKTKKEEERK